MNKEVYISKSKSNTNKDLIQEDRHKNVNLQISYDYLYFQKSSHQNWYTSRYDAQIFALCFFLNKDYYS